MALLPVFVGCAGSARELALVREDVERLHRSNAELTHRVGELEAREATLRVEASDAGFTASKPEEPRPLKVVKLEPPSVKAPPAPEPIDDGEPRLVLRIGSDGASEDYDTPVKVKKGSGTPTPQAAKDYDSAYALVKAKKMQAALEAFAGFLVRYPDHPYAANALYWRGECYWALGDFTSAATQFEGLVARFPGSPKSADGLLKLGLAQRKLGSSAKAKLAFDRLRKEFPTSEAAKKIPPQDAS